MSAHFIPAGCLIGLHFAGSNTYGCVALVTIALGTGSAISVTSMMNPHDLSPNFAVTIFGFMHTIASTPGWVKNVSVTRLKVHLYSVQVFISYASCLFHQRKGEENTRIEIIFCCKKSVFFILGYWRWVVLHFSYWSCYNDMFSNNIYLAWKCTSSEMEQNWGGKWCGKGRIFIENQRMKKNEVISCRSLFYLESDRNNHTNCTI